MKKKLGLILVITFLLFLALEVTSASSDLDKTDSVNYVFPYERPGWSEDLRHTGAKCYQCHFSLLEKDRALGISCKCHYVNNNKWDKNVDMQIIENIHNNGPCIRCHIGLVTQIGQNEIHKPHVEKPCEVCHLENEQLIRPNTTDCNVCHPYGSHGSHDNLNSLCVLCHGKYGESYSISSNEDVNRILGIDSNSSSSSKMETGGIPTIGNVIQFLFNSIFEVKWPKI